MCIRDRDSQSVVHSHPYYELVLPLVGSNVRYSVDGNIYDINPVSYTHLDVYKRQLLPHFSK